MAINVKLRQRFIALYRGLDRAHGVYQLTQRAIGGKKLVGKARTEHGEVTEALWIKHLAGEQGLGIVPITDDATCWFGAIDIDKYDINIKEVEAQVATLGLPVLPTRTKSGGVHLYVFGSEPLRADLLKRRLEEWSVALGYGGSEVFPKQSKLLSKSDVGNWLNMPYFNSDSGTTDRYGVLGGKQLDIKAFVERAERLRISNEQLEALAMDEGDDFNEGPPCLQSLARGGFPEGMRNNGLFAVGVYLKKRYPDEWETHLHAYNTKFFKPPLGHAEVTTLAKTLGRKEYNFTCDKPPIKSFCNRSLCRTREFGVGKGSEDWGVVIDGGDALKINGDPPYWIITVNGQRIQMFSEDILNQRAFLRKCVEALGFYPMMLPADKWRAEMNKMMMGARSIEAPPDAGTSGELRWFIQQFCTVFPQAETKEEILTGKPFIEDGVVYFRGADFRKYLDSQHFRALNGMHLFAEAKRLGVGHDQLWVKGLNIHVWTIKAFEQPPEVPTKRVTSDGDL